MKNIYHQWISLLTMLGIFIGGPLLGVLISGASPAGYLSFPPVAERGGTSSFSWIVFVAIAILIIVTTHPFWRRFKFKEDNAINNPSGHFPWWGWIATTATVVFWILAWNRFPRYEVLQRLTFFPLWFSFIITLNALAVWFTGKSLLTHRSRYFILLFPVSALFWWAFEYLNRFVNNWHYAGISEMGGTQYFAEASLAFSTVLPAVMSVQFLLLKTNLFASGFTDFHPLPWITSQTFWKLVGAVSVGGLVLIGWLPNLTYPLVWILPGLLWITYQRWNNYINPMLRDAAGGDWTLVWGSACAALLCGFFWEMWNLYSLAKWFYTVPGVDRFHIFEMPLLGYAGYLPFGIICALISDSLYSTLYHRKAV